MGPVRDGQGKHTLFAFRVGAKFCRTSIGRGLQRKPDVGLDDLRQRAGRDGAAVEDQDAALRAIVTAGRRRVPGRGGSAVGVRRPRGHRVAAPAHTAAAGGARARGRAQLLLRSKGVRGVAMLGLVELLTAKTWI